MAARRAAPRSKASTGLEGMGALRRALDEDAVSDYSSEGSYASSDGGRDGAGDSLARAQALNARLKRMEREMAEAERRQEPARRRQGGATHRAAAAAPPRRPHVAAKRRPSQPAAPAGSRRASLRVDGAHTKAEMHQLQRDNMLLLRNLEQIQRKGSKPRKAGAGARAGGQPRGAAKHVAASSVNRKKGLSAIERENMAFLKRLEGVKSTVRASKSPGASGSGARVRARPGPPRPKSDTARTARKPAPRQRPEWSDRY